jgi:hypothetical protein
VQVDALLSQVEKSERDSDVLISSLETLAKIAWNDDEVSKCNLSAMQQLLRNPKASAKALIGASQSAK